MDQYGTHIFTVDEFAVTEEKPIPIVQWMYVVLILLSLSFVSVAAVFSSRDGEWSRTVFASSMFVMCIVTPISDMLFRRWKARTTVQADSVTLSFVESTSQYLPIAIALSIMSIDLDKSFIENVRLVANMFFYAGICAPVVILVVVIVSHRASRKSKRQKPAS